MESRISLILTELKAEKTKFLLAKAKVISYLDDTAKALFFKARLIKKLKHCLTSPEVNSSFSSLCAADLYATCNKRYHKIKPKLIGIYAAHIDEYRTIYDEKTSSIVKITEEIAAEILEKHSQFLDNIFKDLFTPIKEAKNLNDVQSLTDKLITDRYDMLSELDKVNSEKERHNTLFIAAESEIFRLTKEIEAAGGLPTICFSGRLSDVKRHLAEFGNDAVNQINQFGELPLHRACEGGHLEIVKLLVSRGAEPLRLDNKIQSQDRYNAFHYACGADTTHFHTLKYLCDEFGNGLVLASTSTHKKTLLHYAILQNAKLIVAWLLQPTFSCFSFFKFFRNEIDVNALDEMGSTGLHIAAYSGFDTITQMLLKRLLERGADIYLKDSQGLTAMQLALVNKSREVLQVFFNNRIMLKDEEVQSSIAKLPEDKQKEISDFWGTVLSGYGTMRPEQRF